MIHSIQMPVKSFVDNGLQRESPAKPLFSIDKRKPLHFK